jgi:hypothetical protein
MSPYLWIKQKHGHGPRKILAEAAEIKFWRNTAVG